jgi:hypothetical protein
MSISKTTRKYENYLILVGILLWASGILLMPYNGNPLLSKNNAGFLDLTSWLLFFIGTVLIAVTLYNDPLLPEGLRTSLMSVVVLLLAGFFYFSGTQIYHPEVGAIEIPSFRWIAVALVIVMSMPDLIMAILVHKGIWKP